MHHPTNTISQERIFEMMGIVTPRNSVLTQVFEGIRFAILSFLSAPFHERTATSLQRRFAHYMRRYQVDFGTLSWGQRVLATYYQSNIDGWHVDSYGIAKPMSIWIETANANIMSSCDRVVRRANEVLLMKYTLSNMQHIHDGHGKVSEDWQLALNAVSMYQEGASHLKLCLYYLDRGEIAVYTPSELDIHTSFSMLEDRVCSNLLFDETSDGPTIQVVTDENPLFGAQAFL